ncbi:MAG: hypothetical protein ROO76_03610 [Terriglobia bacterium]|jgi:hypothetical protein|nr:hypothetical protein [Terriglobia bacterium]
MVYLTIAIVVLAVALWKISSLTDPHHTFFVSLLPMLDLEHSAGVACDFELDHRTDRRAA